MKENYGSTAHSSMGLATTFILNSGDMPLPASNYREAGRDYAKPRRKLLERYYGPCKYLASSITENSVVAIGNGRASGQADAGAILRNGRARNAKRNCARSSLNTDAAIREQAVINIHL